MGNDEVTPTTTYQRVVSKGGKVGYFCRNCCIYMEETPTWCPSCARLIIHLDHDQELMGDARSRPGVDEFGGSDF